MVKIWWQSYVEPSGPGGYILGGCERGKTAFSTAFQICHSSEVYLCELISSRESTRTSLSCLTLCDPMDVACQAPLSKEFPRQKYWSGLPFPPPGDFLTQGSNLSLLLCRKILNHEPPGAPLHLRRLK